MQLLKHTSNLINFLRTRSGRWSPSTGSGWTPRMLVRRSLGEGWRDLSTRLLRSLYRGERRERHSFKKFLSFICTGLILGLRPLLGPSICKYEPSCTKYAAHCLAELPFHKATWAIIKRVLSCNPFF
jgi:putative component of membrane protein insertase Oxa1/YidC/SpoIIIJ protein YidD